jgi:hypothetical protein
MNAGPFSDRGEVPLADVSRLLPLRWEASLFRRVAAATHLTATLQAVSLRPVRQARTGLLKWCWPVAKRGVEGVAERRSRSRHRPAQPSRVSRALRPPSGVDSGDVLPSGERNAGVEVPQVVEPHPSEPGVQGRPAVRPTRLHPPPPFLRMPNPGSLPRTAPPSSTDQHPAADHDRGQPPRGHRRRARRDPGSTPRDPVWAVPGPSHVREGQRGRERSRCIRPGQEGCPPCEDAQSRTL